MIKVVGHAGVVHKTVPGQFSRVLYLACNTSSLITDTDGSYFGSWKSTGRGVSCSKCKNITVTDFPYPNVPADVKSTDAFHWEYALEMGKTNKTYVPVRSPQVGLKILDTRPSGWGTLVRRRVTDWQPVEV